MSLSPCSWEGKLSRGRAGGSAQGSSAFLRLRFGGEAGVLQPPHCHQDFLLLSPQDLLVLPRTEMVSCPHEGSREGASAQGWRAGSLSFLHRPLACLRGASEVGVGVGVGVPVGLGR